MDGWASLGGTFTSGPAPRPTARMSTCSPAAPTAPSGPIADQRGLDVAGSRSAATSTSAPAADRAPRHVNYLDVAIKGGDNTIYLNTYVPGSGWSPLGRPRRQPDVGAGAGLALRRDPGYLRPRHRRQRCTSRRGTARNGSAGAVSAGGIIGAPAAVNKQPHDLDVYVRGGGNAIYQDHWDSVSSWSGVPPARCRRRRLRRSPRSSEQRRERDPLLAQRRRDVHQGLAEPRRMDRLVRLRPDRGPDRPRRPRRAAPEGEVNLLTGISCTPVGGLLHVSIKVRKLRARPSRASCGSRSLRAVRAGRCGWTVTPRSRCGSGSTARPDSSGRIYARVYFRRSKHGALKHKLVFRRYRVCGRALANPV